MSRDNIVDKSKKDPPKLWGKCIDNSGYESLLIIDKIYELKDSPYNDKSLYGFVPEGGKDFTASAYKNRFELVLAVKEVLKIEEYEVNQTINVSKQNEESNMSKQVQLVNIKLFDDDAGLKPEDRIVSYHTNFATVADTTQSTICNALLKLDIAGDISKHNEKRAQTIDLHVLKNTGNKVFLQPIEFDDLRVEVTKI